jgi:phage-related protein
MYIGEMVLFMQAILKIHKLMKKLSKTQKRNKNIGKLNAMRVISRM